MCEIWIINCVYVENYVMYIQMLKCCEMLRIAKILILVKNMWSELQNMGFADVRECRLENQY